MAPPMTNRAGGRTSAHRRTHSARLLALAEGGGGGPDCVERPAGELGERLVVGRVGPLGEAAVEGAQAELGGQARGQLGYAPLLQGRAGRRDQAEVLGRRALAQLVLGGDQCLEPGAELTAVVGE